MVKPLAVVMFVAALQDGGGPAQEPSGWASRGGRDVEIVRIRPGSGSARGWNGFVEALQSARSYPIEITQTAERVAIAFPGGASNMLTLPETPLGPEPSSHVVNRGDWWT